MKKIILVILFLLVGTEIAHADIAFKDATGDSRVVGLLYGSMKQPGCAGTLVEPQIVYTAAHCVARVFKNENFYETNTWSRPIESGNITEKFLDLFVTYPGIKVPATGTDQKVRVIAQFAPKEYKDSCQVRKCHPSLFDFAVLILEKPIPTKSIRYANAQEIEQLINSNTIVSGLGYGTRDWNEFLNAVAGNGLPGNPTEFYGTLRSENDILFEGTKELNSPYKKFMTLETKFIDQAHPGPGALSGGGLFANINGESVYIGALSAVNGLFALKNPQDPLWQDEFWSKNSGGEYYTAQAFSDIITLGNDYLSKITKPVVVEIIVPTPTPTPTPTKNVIVSKTTITKKVVCPKTKKTVSKACKV